MAKKDDDESITTMFKTFVHDHRMSRLKDFWGGVLVFMFVIGFFFAIGSYLVYYCGEKHPGKSLDYCTKQMKSSR